MSYPETSTKPKPKTSASIYVDKGSDVKMDIKNLNIGDNVELVIYGKVDRLASSLDSRDLSVTVSSIFISPLKKTLGDAIKSRRRAN
jgi:hypothetical protein